MQSKPPKSAPVNPNLTSVSTRCHTHTQRNYAIHLGVNAIMVILLVIPAVKLGIDFYPTQLYSLKPTIYTIDDRDVVLMKFLPCENKALRTVVRQYDRYWLLENYLIGLRTNKLNCSSAITYCTHGRDINFFTQLPIVAASWNAPISVALYATGTDFVDLLNAIQYVRHCLFESSIIRDWVSFHIVVPIAHMTKVHPITARDQPFACNHSVSQYQNWNYTTSYAYRMNLPYPVNVLMNLARRAANTYFYMHADIDLIPISSNVWNSFLDMVKESVCLQYDLVNGGTGLICQHLYGKDTVLKKLHMLPAWTIVEKHLYELTKFQLKTGTIIPDKLSEFLWLYRDDRAKHIRTIDPTFFGNPMVPYFDERIYWHTNDRYRHMQTYAICLLQTQFMTVDGLFLAFYEKTNQSTYPNKEIFIKEAAHLNSTVLQTEYGNLYGAERKDACRMCFYRFKPCF